MAIPDIRHPTLLVDKENFKNVSVPEEIETSSFDIEKLWATANKVSKITKDQLKKIINFGAGVHEFILEGQIYRSKSFTRPLAMGEEHFYVLLNNKEKDERIGVGIYKCVCNALDVINNRLIAVAVRDSATLSLEDLSLSVERELKLLEPCKSPNLHIPFPFTIKTKRPHAGEEDSGGIYYTFSEKMKGSLDILGPTFPFEEKITLAIDFLRGLEELHKKNLIHRDVKPANILVGEKEGRPYAQLCDFDGLCPIDDENGLREKTGTTTFLSPKCLPNAKIGYSDTPRKEIPWSKKSDIWSAGLVLFNLFRNEDCPDFPYQEPLKENFPKNTPEKNQRLNQLLIRQHLDTSGIDSRIRKLILQMLQINPENRPTATECIKTLEAICPSKKKSDKPLAKKNHLPQLDLDFDEDKDVSPPRVNANGLEVKE